MNNQEKPIGQWYNSREVVERVFVRGNLYLETPTHFGNGDGSLVDMPLLYDPSDGKTPLLTGASIAGALRNYLREFEKGFGWDEIEHRTAVNKSLAEDLFGHLDDSQQEQKATVHSWLMIDDALGKLPVDNPVEIRDGVTIDPKSGTAEDGKKYDIELLAAGTTFEINFELWLTEDNREQMLEALAITLHGLESGAIGLGMRKRRGYGQCKVTGWQVKRYDMRQVDGVLGWLNHAVEETGEDQSDIINLLFADQSEKSIVVKERSHSGDTFTLVAKFRLTSSLLIRSASGKRNSVDMVHLQSWRNGREKQEDIPILSGTSLAGVIRSRALRIANTIKPDVAAELVDGLFGKHIENQNDEPSGSRVVVRETEIENGIDDRIQNRVKIDRFTGGSYPQALFSQQPLFGKTKDKTIITIQLEIRKPHDLPEEQFEAEVGLLLLVLKDLWTEDLPLGGERSVGRGRLQGIRADMTFKGIEWSITQNGDGLILKGQDEMEQKVTALHSWPGEPKQKEAALS